MALLSPLAQQFIVDWLHHYPGRAPLGWSLRDGLLPWVRFHALPESKRYAETAADKAIILTRANALGDRLLGRGAPCWVIEAQTVEDERFGHLAMEWVEEDDPDSPAWYFYVRDECWQSGAYDDVLLSIADDQPGRAIWMARQSGAIFAPYDGGFDLFPPSLEDVETLKGEWPNWLPDHPEGLDARSNAPAIR